MALLAFLDASCKRANVDVPAIEGVPVVQTAGGPMVQVPAGTFRMGSRHGQADAGPVHEVTLDAFLMDVHEVTQAEFARLKMPNPSHFKGADLPVEQVTWTLAAEFCNKRSQAEGLQACYNDKGECDFQASGYRLPTEAEWEYACRAGTDTEWSPGSDERGLGDHAWYAANAGQTTHAVGQKKPNRWGLHDMHGNVAEWCNDAYAKDYYATSPPRNPTGPAEGTLYVLRGGAWNSKADTLRSAQRAGENPGFADACFARDTIGFRCVRKPPAAKAVSQLQPQVDRQPVRKAKTALVYHEACLEHQTGKDFPERPTRLAAILERLERRKLLAQLETIKPVPADLKWIERIHSPEYIARVKRTCEGAGEQIRHLDSSDVPVCGKSYLAALYSAGAPLAAIDAVMAGKVRNAFCAIRPPGHHALKNRAMGFCIFNNVAIAARYLQQEHRLARVLIIDWDVHHGNGTQDAFYEDGSVLYFSTHQSPWYPHTGNALERGKGKGLGHTINVPLPAGAGDQEVLQAWNEKLLPAARDFKPDFVLISAGFDSHRDDPLGGLTISTECYARLTRLARKIADHHCQGRLISMLEGGYHLDNLADSVEAHIRALME